MNVAMNQNAIEDVKKLGEIIKDIKFCMMTFQNSQGSLQSCPLTTQDIEFDGDLWFIVGKNSEFIRHIEAHPEVNANYSSAKGSYVSISGRASQVEDSTKLAQLWSEVYKVWFPEGLQDPNIALVKVDVSDAEYWDSPGSAVVKMAAFAKAYLTGDRKSVGEHRKVHLN